MPLQRAVEGEKVLNQPQLYTYVILHISSWKQKQLLSTTILHLISAYKTFKPNIDVIKPKRNTITFAK